MVITSQTIMREIVRRFGITMTRLGEKKDGKDSSEISIFYVRSGGREEWYP